jgi:tRNA(fMet)-specific endonuclease VapC
MFLLDTNICIYLIKKKPPRVLERLTSLAPTEVAISSITLAELEFGVAKSQQGEQNRRALDLFTAPLEVADFDAPAARQYGLVRSDLERRGKPICGLDLLIAAHALSLGATLVTNNVREFTQVTGLAFENWARG